MSERMSDERRTTICVRRLPCGKPRKELELSMYSYADRPHGLVRVAGWSYWLAERAHSAMDVLGMAILLLEVVSLAGSGQVGRED